MYALLKWHWLCYYRVTLPALKSQVKCTGAPNDQFVEKCIIIPQLMKIYLLLRHFKVFFNTAGEKLSVPFSQQDTQEISQPG